jgi:biopolymer transport protein ExbD
MPKIKKLRRHKVVDTTQPYTDINTDKYEQILIKGDNKVATEQSLSLSRGQRKRQVRKERIMLKMGKPIARTVQQEGNIHSSSSKLLLSELETTLKESADSIANSVAIIRPSASSAITSNKMKKEIAVREVTRMKLVQARSLICDIDS